MADIDTLRPEVREALDRLVYFLTGTHNHNDFYTIRAELLRLAVRNAELEAKATRDHDSRFASAWTSWRDVMSKLMLAARDGFLDSIWLTMAIPAAIVTGLGRVVQAFLIRPSGAPKH